MKGLAWTFGKLMLLIALLIGLITGLSILLDDAEAISRPAVVNEINPPRQHSPTQIWGFWPIFNFTAADIDDNPGGAQNYFIPKYTPLNSATTRNFEAIYAYVRVDAGGKCFVRPLPPMGYPDYDTTFVVAITSDVTAPNHDFEFRMPLRGLRIWSDTGLTCTVSGYMF